MRLAVGRRDFVELREAKLYPVPPRNRPACLRQFVPSQMKNEAEIIWWKTVKQDVETTMSRFTVETRERETPRAPTLAATISADSLSRNAGSCVLKRHFSTPLLAELCLDKSGWSNITKRL